MSLLTHLEFQSIDDPSSSEDIPDGHGTQDDINLNEQIDEKNLECFWDEVVEDIHEDPDWFTFADE